MYAKILKETASQLTLLVVENDRESQAVIGQSLDPFFKEIEYAANEQEGLAFCRSEKFDLVLIDMDTVSGDTHRFIRDVQKRDAFQAIVVYSARGDDAELLLKLVNSSIAGFIPSSATSDEMVKILSNVCGRIYERAMLMHYIEILEAQQEKAISVSCRSECPMKVELKPIVPIVLPTMQTTVEDDDFMFFPEPSACESAEPADSSLYQDYFSFLEYDDREELHDQLGDIDASLLDAFNDRGGDPLYISRLGTSLMRYGNVLLHYQFFSDMGTSILEFGKMISDECESIAARSDDLELLISGFCSGLQTYMVEVWDKNSDNPKFFNDSIINDAGTIMGMIAPSSAADNDDDLVFF